MIKLRTTYLRVLSIAMLLFAGIAIANAQSWNEISSSNRYLWGIGVGNTPDEAKDRALKMLIEQISVKVSSQMVLGDEMIRNGSKSAQYTQTVTRVIETSSSATLDNTKVMDLGKEGKQYKIGIYMLESEVDKIFTARRSKVVDMVYLSDQAEQQGKLDIALRNLSWAYVLLQSTPGPDQQRLDGQTLTTLIQNRRDNILSDLKVTIVGHNGTEMDLQFHYKGKPVTSVDFRYDDGGYWSNLNDAKDGFAHIDLSPGSPMDRISIEIECNYKEQSELDSDVFSVLKAIEPVKIAHATIEVKSKSGNTIANTSTPTAQTAPIAQTPSSPANTFTSIDPEDFKLPEQLADDVEFRSKMETLLQAIITKQHTEIKSMLTANALRMYNRLLKYGNAKLLSKENLTFWSMPDGRVICRGAMMSFSFRSGSKRNFSQDVCVGFNPDGMIDNITFGLGQTATNDILGQSAYPEKIRLILLNFIENYQTAFALRDLAYLKSIFSDDAIIITATVTPGVKAKDTYNISNNRIKYNRLTKEEYMARLATTFDSREYVTLRFNNLRVRRANTGGEIYGIQIEQDYFSPNYCDHGYLFLELNLNNIDEPKIIVRTWQPEPDPEFGIFNENDFPIMQYD